MRPNYMFQVSLTNYDMSNAIDSNILYPEQITNTSGPTKKQEPTEITASLENKWK